MIGRTVRDGAVKMAAAAGRTGLARLGSIAENPWIMRALEWLGRLAGGWLLSGAVIFGSYAPFAVGFAAVSGGGAGGICAGGPVYDRHPRHPNAGAVQGLYRRGMSLHP